MMLSPIDNIMKLRFHLIWFLQFVSVQADKKQFILIFHDYKGESKKSCEIKIRNLVRYFF
jgi:hypothetical protein